MSGIVTMRRRVVRSGEIKYEWRGDCIKYVLGTLQLENRIQGLSSTSTQYIWMIAFPLVPCRSCTVQFIQQHLIIVSRIRRPLYMDGPRDVVRSVSSASTYPTSLLQPFKQTRVKDYQ